MWVALWNVERATGEVAKLQDDVLDSIEADIAVLIEICASRDFQGRNCVRSSVDPTGGSWIAVIGNNVTLIEPLPTYEALALHAMVEVDGALVVIYGSVLPWMAFAHQAPDLVLPDETSAQAFSRLLAEQVNDILALQQRFPDAHVLWAGDFNQTLEGPNFGGRAKSCSELEAALDQVGMRAWNRQSEHAIAGICAIDFICGPTSRAPSHIGRISNVDSSRRRLSDHAGYFIDLEPAQPCTGVLLSGDNYEMRLDDAQCVRGSVHV